MLSLHSSAITRRSQGCGLADGHASAAFGSLVSEKSDEHFYAFALYTDEDAFTIEPSANSIERYEAKLRDTGETDELQPASNKWATAEWAYEGWNADLFTQIYLDLENHRKTLPESEADYALYKKSVHECMIAALKRMDEKPRGRAHCRLLNRRRTYVEFE